MEIELGDAETLTEQIVRYYRRTIGEGLLTGGERLPSTRELASRLGVSRITVERAFERLEAAGLVRPRQGSGTFVLPQPEIDTAAGTGKHCRTGAEERTGSRRPIDLGGGSGDISLFKAEEFRKILNNLLYRDGADAFIYGEAAGNHELRRRVSQILSGTGTPSAPEELLITAGSQHAIALVAELLLPGGRVVTEEATYAGALPLFRKGGTASVGIPSDSEGMELSRLETTLRQERVSFVYLVPTFSNPTGATMSGYRRRELLALCRKAEVPVVEDDYVGDLRYFGPGEPTLKSLDPENVFYIGTYSKALAPGLRLGYVVPPGRYAAPLLKLKEAQILSSPEPLQRGAAEYLTSGRYGAHLQRARRVYKPRMEAARRAVEELLPDCRIVVEPRGGFFLWLALPPGVSARALYRESLDAGVAIAPGPRFFEDSGAGDSFIRLNVVARDTETTLRGLRILSGTLATLFRRE